MRIAPTTHAARPRSRSERIRRRERSSGRICWKGRGQRNPIRYKPPTKQPKPAIAIAHDRKLLALSLAAALLAMNSSLVIWKGLMAMVNKLAQGRRVTELGKAERSYPACQKVPV
jgi:hypothetical protein